MQLTLERKPRELTSSLQPQKRAFGFPANESIFKRVKKKIKEKIKEKFDNIFYYALGTANAVIFVALTLTFFPKKAEAKPPPFYDNSSVFAYVLNTSTNGMRGEKTDFWVKEAGVTYELPFKLSINGTKTGLTAMALGGVTQCDGLPMAETEFLKAAITTNTKFKKFIFSLGARHIVARTDDVNFSIGRMKIHIPP